MQAIAIAKIPRTPAPVAASCLLAGFCDVACCLPGCDWEEGSCCFVDPCCGGTGDVGTALLPACPPISGINGITAKGINESHHLPSQGHQFARNRNQGSCQQHRQRTSSCQFLPNRLRNPFQHRYHLRQQLAHTLPDNH